MSERDLFAPMMSPSDRLIVLAYVALIVAAAVAANVLSILGAVQ